jgi:hypothetical protein
VEADFAKDTGDPEAFLKTAFDVAAKQRSFNADVYYRAKSVTGRFKKDFSLAHLAFDYCPFCGDKYSDDAQIKGVINEQN